MSALVCGRRSSSSSLFPKTSSLISKKRLRCSSSTSPIQRSPPTTKTNTPITTPSAESDVVVADTLLDRLQFIFPAMEMKVLEKVLEQSGGDFESAIMSLIQLCLGASSSANVDDNDDQNYWLFEHQNKRSKQVSDDDHDVASSAGYGNIGTTWPPRACYLPEADVYALPYTVPF